MPTTATTEPTHFYASQQITWTVFTWAHAHTRDGKPVAGHWEAHWSVCTWTMNRKVALRKAWNSLNSSFKKWKIEYKSTETFPQPYRITAAEAYGEKLPTEPHGKAQ